MAKSPADSLYPLLRDKTRLQLIRELMQREFEVLEQTLRSVDRDTDIGSAQIRYVRNIAVLRSLITRFTR